MLGVTNFQILLLLVIALLSFIYWKKATLWVMYWILAAGAVRKWLLMDWSNLLLFVQHVILAGIYIRFLLDKRITQPRAKFSTACLIFLVLWGVLSALNPDHPSLKVAILGLVVHFFYIPLAFIVPSVFPDKEKLISFLRRYALFSLPLLILGFHQFFSPVHDPINAYVGETRSISIVGSHPRVTSTFSYISGYATYLNFLSMILVYLLSARRQSVRFTVILYVLILLSIVNLLMTGSRGPVGITLISVFLYFMISGTLGFAFFTKFYAKAILVFLAVAFFLTSTEAGRETYSAFIQRIKNTEDVKPRVVNAMTPWRGLDETGFFGAGIGITYQGARIIGEETSEKLKEAEDEPQRVLIELGLVGYILVYGLRFFFLVQFWQLFRRLKDRDLSLLALCAFLFQLQFFHFNNMIFNLTSGVFYWFFVGYLFLLPRLDQQAVTTQANAEVASAKQMKRLPAARWVRFRQNNT